jgi:hypothetical protein
MEFLRLKLRHRAERDLWHPNLSLRVHRALSWLERAEQLGAEGESHATNDSTGSAGRAASGAGERSAADTDVQFLLLWIAFNAAYATEIDEKYRESEQQTFRGFLEKLTQLDVAQKRFEQLVWQEFPRSIRVLLDNRFVFADFWKFQNGSLPEAEWQRSFAAANRAAHAAMGKRDTVTVLSIVLSRIYTLRNQVIHGGATWGSSVNRAQMKDCTNFMAKLVPLVIEVMMDHPETLWGEGCYPVVK